LAGIGLAFMVSGFIIPDLMFFGIGIVAVGAFVIKRRRRKIIPLLGAGLVFVSAFVPYIFISISVLTGKAENVRMIRYTQNSVLGFAIIFSAIGAISILTDKKRPVSPPSPGS
jgi:cytochrome bd-type quinol oxidase subunit 2